MAWISGLRCVVVGARPRRGCIWSSCWGGWPGALLAQRVFRHKTRKTSFQVVFYLVVAANLGALGWLLFADVGPGWPLLSGLGEGLRDGL
ncbi:DUF1294 domain-containing protein [Alloalcanivorax xenomutans]|uniref:DUF1294 domain-containing protein n=1 Tax=Alloalcanivorax xenomutans TaxID=1094342 RepID=UPI001F473C4D|nr:DUF1294 domain-containing protein [Alloalcanivorax xenomutans]MCE7524423.1 DUF1294 domain-containing protein [Alloalcanivorax xenomutans]